MGGAVILFDGVCNLCHGTVRFVLPRDTRGHFRFASLQSAAGRDLALRHGGDPAALDTVYVVAEGRLWSRSDAVLEILRHLGPPWRWLAVFRILPRGLRDAVYGLIARHRYTWFGRKERCELPDPRWTDRFLA